MICRLYPFGSLHRLRFVVTLSFREGQILLSRHRERSTWETQGGHIELGETPVQAAQRELFEESGATDYGMMPLCDYQVGDEPEDPGEGCGAVFIARIRALGKLPQSEIAEARWFDALPEATDLTYPEITPVLYTAALHKLETQV